LADWSITTTDREIRGADVSAAYFRRPGTPQIDPAIAEPSERTYCGTEWSVLLKSLYLRLGSRWLNSPEAISRAEDKPRQLLLARSMGFEVPDTVVTNDPAVFEQMVAGPLCVAKPLRHALLEGETDRVIFTSRVQRSVRRDSRAIAAAPMIVQREICKAADVRVTVVGDQVFPTLIHSQEEEEAEVDWRRGHGPELRHEATDLPSDVAMRCVRLVQELGLTFGAIDLVLDREGLYWFLEINPNGQWAWIETRTSQPIAAALVDQLEAIARR
jgi:glutathione synthase/RimK-type ligase-like ATP-grasp enzyme